MTPYLDSSKFLFLIIVLLFYLGLAFAFHLLYAFGPYRMAKHAGIPHAWLGLFPIGTSWLVGLLAERSLYSYTGRRLRLALWTPALWGIGTCGAFLTLGLALADVDFSGLVVAAVVLTIVGWVAGTVFSLYGLYYLFKDYAPENALLYILLGIFFQIQFIFLLIEMNTVPVSVTGPGTFPYGRPKYDRWHRWSPSPAQGYGPGNYPPAQCPGYGQPPQQPPAGGQGYNQPPQQPPANGPGYGQPPQGGQTPWFYQNGGYAQPPAQGPAQGQPNFYQGGSYYQPPAPRSQPRDEEGPSNGPEL